MIIKSHIRGGYRAAANYLKDQGLNEKTRVVEISDPSAKNLDDAFRNMWVVASNTKCTKPLHHISINPMKDERLTDQQVLAIARRCEEKYGYNLFLHQRVIVEHVKDGRQHFHVMWNRVSLMTGRPVWPGEHWKKSKQVCREMEKELGLKRPVPKRMRKFRHTNKGGGRTQKKARHYESLRRLQPTSKSRSFTKSITSKRFKSSHSGFRNTKTIQPLGRFEGSSKSQVTKSNHQGLRKSTTKKGSKGSRSPSGKQKTPAPIIGLKESARIQHVAGRYKSLNQPKLPLIKSFYIKPTKTPPDPAPPSFQPVRQKTGWPAAAILDWQSWGKLSPQRFFAKWPELTM